MAFHQLQTGVLENETIRLEYHTEQSLRIIRCIYKPTGKNLFAETPDFSFPTSYGKYTLRGGHRLWVSPETWDLTYAEENPIIQCGAGRNQLSLKQVGLAPAKISKEIHIDLDPATPVVQVKQIVRNDSDTDIEIAAWGLSMMAPGGSVIVPVRNQESARTGLLPDRALILWPYASLNDRRLDLQDDSIMLHSNTTDDPFKLGLRSPLARLVYLKDGIAFEKHTYFDSQAAYPDFGCNLEVYTNQNFVELEVLSGIQKVAPGGEIELREEWKVYPFTAEPLKWLDQNQAEG
jgi:hypothetical protein